MVAAKYCSGSWRKDLEHVLKVYYIYNLQTPFDKPEWVRVRELFFDRFVAKKVEALRIKEESPLDYMPYIAGEFNAATGICLHELRDFTGWIKNGSYFHWLLVQWGQVEECPHLIGAPMPWPQPKPSESHEESYQQAGGPGVGSREPSAGAPTAPTQLTPAEESPVVETPVPDAPSSDTSAPMETGRAGDGQSWAEHVKTGLEAEFRQSRPPKCPHSESRRQEMRPTLPFPLQDVDGRLASVMKLYKHVGEQLPPRDGIAGECIRHLHTHMMPQDVRQLGNQVVCMIAEYHLTNSSWVSSTLSPVLPEAAKLLLPPLKSYVSNISFEGARDVRVLDHAKTLRVAIWLHQLDMAVRGEELASEDLDALRHCLGHLLESFLVLMFGEVIVRCLYENRRNAQHRLNDLMACLNWICQELDDLMESHGEATRLDRRRIKREMDLRRKDLESLKECISHKESYLQEDMPEQDDPRGDDRLDQGA